MIYIYGVVGALILGLCVAVGFERTQVANRDLTISQMNEQAAQERATFLGEAQKQLEAKQHEVDTANQRAADASTARDLAIAHDRATGVRVLNAERALQDHLSRLPAADQSAGYAAAAETYRVLVESCRSMATDSANEADRLSDEVRRLEASIKQ